MLVSSQVMARCNPELISFGSSVKEVANKFDDKFLFPPDIPEDIPMVPVFVPGEMVCKDEKAFKGAGLEFIFFSGELVEIKIDKISESATLLFWAENLYGVKKDKPMSFFLDSPKAEWQWNKFNSTISYSIQPDIDNQLTESVIIQSARHKKLFEEYGEIEDKALGEEINE